MKDLLVFVIGFLIGIGVTLLWVHETTTGPNSEIKCNWRH
jgi:hypothetical protein